MQRLLSVATGMLYLHLCVHPVQCQSKRPSDLRVGKLLVASRDLPDPNFARTVVLLVQFNDDGVIGLIINRRSQVPVSRVLDTMAGARGRQDAVYAGGPVGQTDILALLRSHKPPGDAKRVLGEVFLVSSRETLEETFAAATGPDKMHVFLGYAGWTEPQLQHEVDLGAWYIFQGSPEAIFNAEPDSLWPRLIRETEVRVARAAAHN
jgi:putative AlgH/UPF0301 family transcriptional regulator